MKRWILFVLAGIAVAGTRAQVAVVRKNPNASVLYTAVNTGTNSGTGKPRIFGSTNDLAGTYGPSIVPAGCSGPGCSGISMTYAVPLWVGLVDRIALASAASRLMSAYLDQQDFWQNAPVDQATRDKMVQIYQDRINQIQDMLDGWQGGCSPDKNNFKNAAGSVVADVRYSDPTASDPGILSQAGSQPELDLSALFNGRDPDALDNAPVKAHLVIYKK